MEAESDSSYWKANIKKAKILKEAIPTGSSPLRPFNKLLKAWQTHLFHYKAWEMLWANAKMQLHGTQRAKGSLKGAPLTRYSVLHYMDWRILKEWHFQEGQLGTKASRMPFHPSAFWLTDALRAQLDTKTLKVFKNSPSHSFTAHQAV